MSRTSGIAGSPWPHGMAWVLACATFPLLWVGGLITTTDAGMAVPDWPGTYGYNLFLYPWRTWLFGPWDLFIEHGHRLLASGIGLLTIAFVVVVWRTTKDRFLRTLAVAALGMVVLQGVLGGMRVVMNERYLAMAHGVTGPLFFALTVGLVATTRPVTAASPSTGRLSAWMLPALVYCQLMLGATLRHIPEDGGFLTFASHVRYHLIVAGVVATAVLALAAKAWLASESSTPRWLASAMAAVVAMQLALGVGTWIAKYRLPGWAQPLWESDAWDRFGGPITIAASTAGGWFETHTVTAHSATGSLLLGLSVAAAATARRLPETQSAAPPTQSPPSA